MHPMLNTAIKAARKAGSIINRASLDPGIIKVTEKEKNDYVTDIDKTCENEILNILRQAYPKHHFLAEELTSNQLNSPIKFSSSHPTWIIDPIDGTTNFIHGFPNYCISIALHQNGEIEQAVVYDPSRDELFTASKGRGAYLNDRRLRVSKQITLDSALIATGFPPRDPKMFDNYYSIVKKLGKSSTSIRRVGSAALELCYVASGRFDGFFELGLMPWDSAAGSLIIQESGGFVGNFNGDNNFLFTSNIVAANPKLFALIVRILSNYKFQISSKIKVERF
ncbi:MAG: inositol monophosphatase [Betaproteobacteria bacterium TMED156]|nr:MAG: inositol monophosphatase [Betaproteobacteria bacterium TMED156]|tara:strand:- start:224 stop:1063 length:840 start_codon:yes stop_codon:yes gene_type:complete